ncbi:ABC transporter ATP-binding protein [Agrobacterium tumefaciens]|uniref:ABC transporter ATP-binding protein n=1 Tax=Agrobacterium tumefaciens TaxID=358 RepID=UPI00157320FC|nr:ABC transporter ATP-binding protein [Agrobacterium tumefaciens]NTE58686.1 ABC transporter ATP-binding protein [Agrobacterium tumefaciens]NTE73118.1 ABC transporter ATP-binding protein [Agrobacterium tumefaciens]UXT51967.1 ABC transporter ATP-binding protein [Agrobacterium tumefaciens]
MARITLNKVTKSWGDTRVLQPMTLSIEDGEFVAVLGPSGCGKSTTLFLLAGLYAPTGGEIAFDGHNVNRIDARDRNVGIVFQSYALYPNLTVRENIAFPLRFKNVPRDEAARRVEEAAGLVQITALLDRRPSQLSGGQQQRVALARALVKEPNILLLDEPLSNLDATLRITMRAELKSLQKRLKITTLIVTHDQIEAITMADRIICMNNGAIAQIGTPDDLYRRPDNLFVAGFIGTPPMNLLKGRAEREELRIGDARLGLNARYDGEITFGLRPEDIALVKPAEARLGGEIATVEPMGREVFYTVDTPAGIIHALEYGETIRHAPGERVGLACASALTLVFDAAGNRIAGLHADLSQHSTIPARAPEPVN